MFGRAKAPLDRHPYAKSRSSRRLSRSAPAGRCVFLVDLDDVIHVAADGPHMHPQVLGGAQSALYAGEITIDRAGAVDEVTNLSGTFRFRSEQSLCRVADVLRRLGFSVADVVWCPPDGSSSPVISACA